MITSNLDELHIKGELASKGYLEEEYNEKSDDLVHNLSDKGYREIRELFKHVEYRQEFMKLAIIEANKTPEFKKQIIEAAMNKLKEYD